MLTSDVFNRLKKRFANTREFETWILDKIEPLTGDLTAENLGLSAEDDAIAVEHLNVIINCAASVKFNEPLKVAIGINFMGISRILELAKKCKHLEVLTQVSTAYVNSNR